MAPNNPSTPSNPAASCRNDLSSLDDPEIPYLPYGPISTMDSLTEHLNAIYLDIKFFDDPAAALRRLNHIRRYVTQIQAERRAQEKAA